MVGVCHTAAAAIKSGEAVTAFLLGVYIAAPELIRNLRLCNAIVYISHQEVLIPYKLVTWIEISPRRYCQVLCAGPTSGKTFGNTRTSFQIES